MVGDSAGDAPPSAARAGTGKLGDAELGLGQDSPLLQQQPPSPRQLPVRPRYENRIQKVLWRIIGVLAVASVLVLVIFGPPDLAATQGRSAAAANAASQAQHSHMMASGHAPQPTGQKHRPLDGNQTALGASTASTTLTHCRNTTLDRGCRFGTAPAQDEPEHYSPIGG